MASPSLDSVDTIEEIKANHICTTRSHARNPLDKTVRTPLKDYIDTVIKLPPEYSVPALCELVDSGLESHVTITGARLVIHPSYCGTYSLNDLARKWMAQGTQLREATIPLLAIRLRQLRAKRDFQKLYRDSTRAVKESCIAWLPAIFRDLRLGCGCCMKDPLYCIPMDMRCDEALYFRQEVWKECFGDEGLIMKDGNDPHSRARSKFGSISWWTAGELQDRWLCEEKMIENALNPRRNGQGSQADSNKSSDTDEDWENVEKS